MSASAYSYIYATADPPFLRGDTYMKSAKILDFGTPSPIVRHIKNLLILFLLSALWGTTQFGRHISLAPLPTFTLSVLPSLNDVITKVAGGEEEEKGALLKRDAEIHLTAA